MYKHIPINSLWIDRFFLFFHLTGGYKTLFPVQTSEGQIKIILKIKKMGVHFDTSCPNEWRDKFQMGFQGILENVFYRFFRRRSKNGLLAKICHHDLINKF